MSPLSGQALVQVINKVPLFNGLKPRQVQAFLNVCQTRSFAPEQHVCGTDTPSDELFILMSGQLAVKSLDGVQLATIDPVTTVGEMGVITHQPRSATVVAVHESRLFVMVRRQFESVLEADPEAADAVYRNIIQILAGKIVNDNVRTRQYVLDSLRIEGRLRELQHTADTAIELLIRTTGMTRAEVENQIAGERRAEVENQIAGERRAAYLEVMIVDDEAEFRRFTRDALPDVGVIEACDGEEAAELLNDRRPDLLITDIRMPNMDGFQLLAHAQEKHPDLPVFALSGVVSQEEIDGKGFAGFIGKPVSIERFRRIVHDALVRDSHRST